MEAQKGAQGSLLLPGQECSTQFQADQGVRVLFTDRGPRDGAGAHVPQTWAPSWRQNPACPHLWGPPCTTALCLLSPPPVAWSMRGPRAPFPRSGQACHTRRAPLPLQLPLVGFWSWCPRTARCSARSAKGIQTIGSYFKISSLCMLETFYNAVLRGGSVFVVLQGTPGEGRVPWRYPCGSARVRRHGRVWGRVTVPGVQWPGPGPGQLPTSRESHGEGQLCPKAHRAPVEKHWNYTEKPRT